MNDETRRAFAARARVMKAMAHESRLYILSVIISGERTVSELTALLGVDVSTVSRHLSVLRDAGLVTSEKRGSQVFYRSVCQCIEQFFSCIESVLQAQVLRGQQEARSRCLDECNPPHSANATKPRILFLCTGNSCRSQMAEGFCRKLRPEFDASSAGTKPGILDSRAVTVMAERDVDISSHRPKSVDELPGDPIDVVVTVCDGAHESCPVLPGTAQTIHQSFDDPPRLAAMMTNEQEALDVYRRVRDEIERFIVTFDPAKV